MGHNRNQETRRFVVILVCIPAVLSLLVVIHSNSDFGFWLAERENNAAMAANILAKVAAKLQSSFI